MSLSIGYAAALEQFSPAEVVRFAALAETHGFEGVAASERFQPSLPQQGQAAHVWSVLAALGQQTSGDLGPVSAVPSFRSHPATMAQASATLAALYPGRHWLSLGPGEAIDEHVVGQYWPEAPERIARLFEAVELIKKLFNASASGRDAKHVGQFFRLESSRLWTMPEQAPEVLISTAGPVTAKRAGRVADGIMTGGAAPERLEQLLTRFAEGARESGRDARTMPRVLHLHLSWASTDEEAMANALREWPIGGMRFSRSDVRSPFEMEQMARLVRPEDFAGRMIVSSDLDRHYEHIRRLVDVGFNRVYLHNVGRNQAEWIEAFGNSVLPRLRS